jgi:alpha-tubulin suppressor-like RCC1 family protein
MAAITLYRDSTGNDIANTYVTKEYVMDWYPDLVPSMTTPQLWGCGYNNSGVLGNNDNYHYSRLITVLGAANWKQVAPGYRHTIALKTDGTLWAWGNNDAGQLGDGTIISKRSPVTVAGGGTNWKQVAAGEEFSAAIKTDGTLWTWGLNARGQLGTGTTTARSSPGTVAGGGTNWKQVDCSNFAALALKTDGTLWSWGGNPFGGLGDGTTTSRSSPGTVIGGITSWKNIYAGGNYSSAGIKTDGTLWIWGGVNATSSPVTVTGGGTNWKQVSCGYSMGGIKTDGTLWMFGSNGSGQLGTNNTSVYTSPVTTAGGGTNWKQVSCGWKHSSAIKTDGTLWVWGDNFYGQLGTNNTSSYSSPVTTAGGGTNWKQVNVFKFTCRSTLVISEAEGW